MCQIPDEFFNRGCQIKASTVQIFYWPISLTFCLPYWYFQTHQLTRAPTNVFFDIGLHETSLIYVYFKIIDRYIGATLTAQGTVNNQQIVSQEG